MEGLYARSEDWAKKTGNKGTREQGNEGTREQGNKGTSPAKCSLIRLLVHAKGLLRGFEILRKCSPAKLDFFEA
jgi:hypothetical protein